jgi:uncharacterized protein YraI
MTNIFAVIGEHRTEPGRLLLLGEDDLYYAYAASGPPHAVESTADWLLDRDLPFPSTAWPETPTGETTVPALDPRAPTRAARHSRFALVAALAVLVAIFSAVPALAHAPALVTATATTTLLAAPAADAPVLATVPTGTEVELTGHAAGDYLEILTGDNQGWIAIQAVDGGRLHTAIVPADAALLAGPGPSAAVVATVPANSTVILTGATVDGYLAASFNGAGGWIAGAALN